MEVKNVTWRWLFLIAAGFFEIGWALSLKATNGFTNYVAVAFNLILGLCAAFCLSQAMRTIPVVTAYPIWKGIAITGLFAWEIFVDRTPVTPARSFFAALIVAGIIGLKLSGSQPSHG